MPDVLERATPLFETVRPYTATNGDLAAEIGTELGYDVDADQQAILDAIFACDPVSGDPVFSEVAVVAPRQNLKTATGIIAAVTDLVVFRLPHLWTSHLYRPTTVDAFTEMWDRISGSDRLRPEFDDPISATGKELIRLRTGERIEFLARSKKAARGTARPRTTLDEALFLTPAQVQAMFPTGVTRSDRQRRILSSAGLAESEYLRQVRDRGRKGSRRLAYVEYGATPKECALPSCPHVPPGEIEGCALDDVDLWRQANPAFGRRITEEALRDMRDSMTPDAYAVEFLSWWEDPAELADGLPVAWWDECENRTAVLADPLVLAFDADEDHASGAIVACGGPVELVQFGRGVDWLPARLAELVAKQNPSAVGFEAGSPAGALLQPLEDLGLSVRSTTNPTGVLVPLPAAEMVQACGAMWVAAQERTLVQHGERAMRIAVRDGKRRASGDAWRWSRRGSQSGISPLVAATIARHLWSSGEVSSVYESRGMVTL